MTVMSSVNGTTLAPGIGGLAQYINILNEPALQQGRPSLHPYCTPLANSTTSKPPPSNVNSSFRGSRAYRFDT